MLPVLQSKLLEEDRRREERQQQTDLGMFEYFNGIGIFVVNKHMLIQHIVSVRFARMVGASARRTWTVRPASIQSLFSPITFLVC
jgi:hypothetical protein